MYAAATGNNEKIKSLLNEGVNVNTADPRDGETALMAASTSKHVDTVKLLLKKGANINRKANHGESALRFATTHNQVDIVKVLLKNGAKPNIKDAIGETPLMLAAQNAGPNGTQIVKLLLNAGASKTLKSNSGETALSLAIREKAARIRDGGAPNFHDGVMKLLSSSTNCSKFRKTVDPKCNNQPNCNWVVGSGCKKK
jgi:ankyrin repeat protein